MNFKFCPKTEKFNIFLLALQAAIEKYSKNFPLLFENDS